MADLPALAGLTTLLGSDPIVAAATAGRARPVSVPEPARALFAATLASSTARRPVVLAVPTGVEAERLAADLREFVGADAVELILTDGVDAAMNRYNGRSATGTVDTEK